MVAAPAASCCIALLMSRQESSYIIMRDFCLFEFPKETKFPKEIFEFPKGIKPRFNKV